MSVISIVISDGPNIVTEETNISIVVTGGVGSQGEDGADGADSQGFTFEGEFTSPGYYATNSVVTYQGSTYLCISGTSNSTPPPSNGTDWALWASKGSTGEQGIQGIQGEQGATGVAGNPATNLVTSVAGRQGVVILDTSDISEITNKRYVTDAQQIVIGNTSGSNSGDNATNTQYSGLAASKEDTSNKQTDLTASATKFPTVNAVNAGLDLKVNKANNLSDLTSASTARTNLGLGTLATQSGTFSGTSSGTNSGDQNDHNAMTNLATGDVHTQYTLLAGRSGGQTLIGGTGVTDPLRLRGTSGNGTAGNKGLIFQVGNNGSIEAINITNDGTINTRDIVPISNNARDLGSSGFRWKDVWFSGASTGRKATLTSTVTADINLTLKAIAAQTGNFLELTNSSNTVLSYIKPDGSLNFGTTTGAGRLNFPDAGTTASDGIQFGTGTSNLYRSGPNSIKTDGILLVGSNIITGGTVRLKGYTVATLPAGVVGDTAYVTDSLAPTFLVAVAGGGSVTTSVFFNGSTWVAQ